MRPASNRPLPLLEEFRLRGLKLDKQMRAGIDLLRLQAYYDFLVENNERAGFFSRRDGERILERHLYECLIFALYTCRHLNVSRETTLADAGSGPGLPGYLFACLRDAPRISLYDSSRRRLGLLQSYNASLAIPASVNFRYERLETCSTRHDVIAMRALIPFPFCIELVCKMQTVGGQIALAAAIPPELDRHSAYLKDLGYVSRETLEPVETQFLPTGKINILLKSHKTKKGYPRNWKRIKEDLAKWERS